MKFPSRPTLRILVGLFLAGAAVVLAVVLMLDSIVREVVTRRMQAATGMDVTINSVHVDLISPTITIKGLKLYNTAEFGSSLCLDMPELHLEYDPLAARSGVIHLPLVRLNVASIGVVQDKKGHSNFDAVEKQARPGAAHTNAVDRFKFSSIDTLDLSLGKLHVTNLRLGQSEEIDFGIKNQIFHNVKSEADLTGMALFLAMRGSASPGHSGLDLSDLLKDLTLPKK